MAREMQVRDWLAVLRQEYLEGFLPQRGAAVKFTVPFDETARADLLAELQQTAEAAGYLFVLVDSAVVRANLIDHVFFAVARQVDWDTLAFNFLRRLLASEFHLPEAREDFTLAGIADLNGYDARDMRVLINQMLTSRLSQDYSMIQDFRTAILWLCRAQMNPDAVHGGVAEGMRDWLRGDLRVISAALRSAGIFRRIGRHNGRHMLTSLAYWLHQAGHAGLALAVDISSFLEAKRSLSGALYYSRPAIMDGYELLRQFVDGVDEMEYCLLAVVAPPSFLNQEVERGLWAYDALRLRIWDEVHDIERPNPLSPLIRLAAQAEPLALSSAVSRV